MSEKWMTKKLAELTARRTACEASDKRAAEAVRQASEDRDAFETELAGLIVDVGRHCGLYQLAPEVIAAGLHHLAIHGRDEETAARWISEFKAFGPKVDRPSAKTLQGHGRGKGEATETIDVQVLVGRNVGQDKQTVLAAHGMRWNGRKGLWGGTVTPEEVEALRYTFGDKLAVFHAKVGQTPSAEPVQVGEPEVARDRPERAEASRGLGGLEADHERRMMSTMALDRDRLTGGAVPNETDRAMAVKQSVPGTISSTLGACGPSTESGSPDRGLQGAHTDASRISGSRPQDGGAEGAVTQDAAGVAGHHEPPASEKAEPALDRSSQHAFGKAPDSARGAQAASTIGQGANGRAGRSAADPKAGEGLNRLPVRGPVRPGVPPRPPAALHSSFHESDS